jgi:hypothetical protein
MMTRAIGVPRIENNWNDGDQTISPRPLGHLTGAAKQSKVWNHTL